jgi:hypothetical protein
MHLRWQPNSSTSALHAAQGCWRFPDRITDPEVLATLGPYAEHLGGWIANASPADESMLWDTLIATGCEIESNGDLAAAVLRKCGLAESADLQSERLAGLITDVEAAFAGLFPQYLPQCPLRLRPLQEQWLGYGRGLMSQWKRLVRIESLIDGCRVIGVQPVVGGYGKSHPDQNLVRIEAVLTNSRPELPEVVRLAWLIAQLHIDPPWLDELNALPLSEVMVPLAMIPAMLAAAQEMELARCDHDAVALAIEHWLVSIPQVVRSPRSLSANLLDWWQTEGQTGPDWGESLRIFANRLVA